jgi:hypothetical protein
MKKNRNRSSDCLRAFAILVISAGAGCAQALNPNLPPGQNFDLSHWYLTLPVDSSGATTGTAVTISAAQLAAGYTNPPYFYTGTDGAMVFYCPATGATTSGSTNPRSELREELNTNDNSVDWTANGVNVLTAQCMANDIASGGQMGIGQVHGYNPNMPLVILRYDNSLNQGVIDATVKYNTSNAPVNGNTDATLTFTNVGLNQLINYQIVVSNGVAIITVNGQVQSQNFYATDPNWTNASFYFKLGDYYVNNGGTTNASQVSFYALAARHLPYFDGVVQSGSNLTFDGICGLTNSNYYVLSATNLALPLTNWTTVATNSFDSNGNFVFTNPIGPASQNFFILKLP